MAHQHSGARPNAGWRTGLAILLLPALLPGCATSPRTEAVIFESPRVSVYLEHPSDAFEATHPITLSPALLERVLKGVLVTGRKTALETIFTDTDQFERVFSDEEARLLAPLLTKALAQAKPTQRVRFTVTQPPRGPRRLFSMSETGGAAVGSSDPPPYEPPLETSAATLYVFRPSLYLTLTEYRQKPSRPDSINMPNRRLPDADGLDRIDILFTPKAALQPESFQEPGVLGEPHLTPIILDYERLASLPEPKPKPASQPQPAPPAAAGASDQAAPTSSEGPPARSEAGAPGDLHSLKESLAKQEQELKALREELESLRSQQEERNAAGKHPKPQRKATPP
ncbi:hypothetical protein [Nitrospira sp. Kam-Ns4a]